MFSLSVVPVSSLPETPAARCELVMDLYRGWPVFNDEGELVGYGPGLIDKETAIRLLNHVADGGPGQGVRAVDGG